MSLEGTGTERSLVCAQSAHPKCWSVREVQEKTIDSVGQAVENELTLSLFPVCELPRKALAVSKVLFSQF